MTDLVKFEDLSLEALTEAAKEAFEEVNWSLEKTLERAIRFGRILTAVKAKLPHGKWVPWVLETFEDTMSLRNVQRYMRVANATNSSLLGCAETIDEALDKIAVKKPSVEVLEPERPDVLEVQAEEPKPKRESAPSERPRREPSDKPQAAPFHLGERLQDDREAIMGMAGDYAEHKKLADFCDMLTKCVKALRGEA